MPFGFEAAEKSLSSGLQGLTSNISQMLMGDYMRKQGEQETVRKEKRAWEQKQKELKLVFEYNKDLAKVDADLKAEMDDNWRNDPYVKALQKRVGSGEATPEEQAIFEGSMEIMESQSQLTPLSDEQLDFIDQIRPQFPTIAIGLYDQELKRAEFAKQIDMENQRIKAMYGGREATAARAERTYRDKEHATLKKTSSDIAKQIYITKEKLAKEETKVKKWEGKEDIDLVRTPEEEGYKARKKITSKRKMRAFDFPIETEETLAPKGGFEQPENIEEIKNLRQQLRELERKQTIAIEAIEGEIGATTYKKKPGGGDPVEGILEEIRAGNIPTEITEAMKGDPELTFEKAVEEYIRWKLEIKD